MANEIDGLTVATVLEHTVVRPGQRVATVKVIPYSLPAEALARVEAIGRGLAGGSARSAHVVSVLEIPPQSVDVVLVGSGGSWSGALTSLGDAIEGRIRALGGEVRARHFVPLDESELAETLSNLGESGGAAMIIVAGETAIMDRRDLVPRSIRRAGGSVEHLGLAMDPGHLLLLGYLDAKPVVGAPGCVRGSVPDGFDAVVPRLLAGERLEKTDLQALGHGGLLSDPRVR